MTPAPRPAPAVQLQSEPIAYEAYAVGCAPACPCQVRRSFAGTWTVFSTGDEMRLEQVPFDVSGLGMTADRLARTWWFAWRRVA